MIQDGFNEALYLKRVPVNVFSTALNTLDPTEGKAFLVTGGGSGLGASVARRLVKEKAKVVIVDLNEAAAQQVVGELGSSAIFAKADVANEEQVTNAVAKAIETFGTIHGAINCAGISSFQFTVSPDGPFPLDVFSKVINTNLIGTFNVIRLVANAISKSPPASEAGGDRGVFINTSSIAAFEGQQGQVAYTASKAGIIGMTLPLAREFASFGIRVVAVSPGVFDTPMLAGVPAEARASVINSIPFPPRLGIPDEFANLCVHIIQNQYLNGDTIRLDGGLRISYITPEHVQ